MKMKTAIKLIYWSVETKDAAKIPTKSFVMDYPHELGSSTMNKEHCGFVISCWEVFSIYMIQDLQKIGIISKAPNHVPFKFLGDRTWYLY